MESHLNKQRAIKTMQSLKNIVINGLMVLGLSFGLMISATAVSVSKFEKDKSLAESGNSFKQGILGTYYRTGQGVRQDHSKAFYWYQKSADQGDVFGQFYVGHAYAKGQGVRQDHSKALEWLKRAAAQNSPTAQGYIGTMYAYGQGVRQNKTIAKEWYGKSCDNGNQDGCDLYRELNEQGY